MSTILSLLGQRTLLQNVRWETYAHLLADHVDASAPRFTFDRGALEIMSPSSEHEDLNWAMARIVEALAEARGLEFRNLGSTTFKRRDLERGFEADSCFYIQSADRMRYRRQVDPEADPPPDLAIEIEISAPVLNKLPIYAAFGVPEIWRYDGKRVAVLELSGSGYIERDTSLAFPGVPTVELAHQLENCLSSKRIDWLRAVRNWARTF